MKLIAEITKISYCVELTSAQWDKLNADEDYFLDVVCPKMKAVGVDDRSIEYNGHFGSNIFFDITPDIDISAVLNVISEFVD